MSWTWGHRSKFQQIRTFSIPRKPSTPRKRLRRLRLLKLLFTDLSVKEVYFRMWTLRLNQTSLHIESRYCGDPDICRITSSPQCMYSAFFICITFLFPFHALVRYRRMRQIHSLSTGGSVTVKERSKNKLTSWICG